MYRFKTKENIPILIFNCSYEYALSKAESICNKIGISLIIDIESTIVYPDKF